MRHIIFIFALSIISCFCYSQKIKGTVSDAQGKLLPHASIFVKENNKGTTSNIEGKYSLKLEPGQYTIICQHVGFKKEERKVTISNNDIDLNFILGQQEMTLGEVVIKSGEDPAYQIIRNAIKKRPFHDAQLDKFEVEVYTKGQLRLRDYPKKIFGQKVDFEDGDTSKNKILYLSETVSKYAADKPNKTKIEVMSSRVSGQTNGFGLAAPVFLSFYDNNIFIGENLNPRGFISPIADNALNYYRYKLEGSYFEDGREISHIKVTPRRTYEPLFSGYIDIVANDWRFHSLQLLLTKSSQMERLDTLRIEQSFRPGGTDAWYVSSQVIYPAVKALGFDVYGHFVNIYSDFKTIASFDKDHFTKTIIKYTDSSNKKTEEYWEQTRPLALLEDEKKDYRRKDSLETLRRDPAYTDSLDKKRNKVRIMNVLFLGQNFQSTKKRTSLQLPSLLQLVSFNPAEGWVLYPSFTWTKRLDTNQVSRRNISITPAIRYGFANKHVNPHLTFSYTYGKKLSSTIMLSGGKRVFQFNNNSPIGWRGNSISSLWNEENRIKSYEAIYARGSYKKAVSNGLTLLTGFQYQDRMPLDNRTDYTWRNKAGVFYTPNYPVEIMTSNIKRHQVFMLLAGVTWQPGARYIKLPGRTINLGSKHPVFSAEYIQGIENVFGSDEQFSKWKLGIRDDINFKLKGKFRYRLGVGGFLDTGRNVQVPDYNHFNGNLSTFATEYLNSFQLLPIYQFSNLSKFYALAHLEHNFNGFLTNKIPGIKKLNIYLVAGANGFYINRDKNYYEVFAGIDNIFKQFRVDYVQSFLDGKKWQSGFRVGLGRIGGRRGDDWP